MVVDSGREQSGFHQPSVRLVVDRPPPPSPSPGTSVPCFSTLGGV